MHRRAVAYTFDHVWNEAFRLPRPVRKKQAKNADIKQIRVWPRQGLGRQLARAEIPSRRYRCVFADPAVIRLIHRAARYEAEHRGTGLTAIFQQGRCSIDVDPKHLRRVVRKISVVTRLRQMRHGIDAVRQIARCHGAFQIPKNIRTAR